MIFIVNYFSTLYKGRKDIFERLKIWQYEEYQKLQGTVPVIFMTFAAVKASDFVGAIHTVSRYCYDLYVSHGYIMDARTLITGITNIPKESLFSDVNNIAAYTITSTKYADSFGFTEREVFACFACQDVVEQQMVKDWCDGFTFGGIKDIYNPWSIINYIGNRQFKPYWVNSGGYNFVSQLFLKGKSQNKNDLQSLLEGKSIHKVINKNLTYLELDYNSEAVWSFLVTVGYLRTDNVKIYGEIEADLPITNRETMIMFQKMVKEWFGALRDEYNAFCNALIQRDVETMNTYINYVAMEMVSVFDVGRRPSEKVPKRFYHGLVLGVVVDLREEYEIISNRESGFGRYDIMMRPKKEAALEDALLSALIQIQEKRYEQELLKPDCLQTGYISMDLCLKIKMYWLVKCNSYGIMRSNKEKFSERTVKQ